MGIGWIRTGNRGGQKAEAAEGGFGNQVKKIRLGRAGGRPALYIHVHTRRSYMGGGHELIITTKLYDLVFPRIPVQGFTKGPCRCGTCAVLCCAERSTVKKVTYRGREKTNKERHSNDSKNAEP